MHGFLDRFILEMFRKDFSKDKFHRSGIIGQDGLYRMYVGRNITWDF